MASLKFSEDAKAKLYRMHFALLAAVKDQAGKVVERVSQDYPFQGPLEKLPQLRQGNVVFKRRLVVPPGSYAVELVAQDRDSGATSVYRTPLEVPAQQALAVSSVVVVRRMEPAPPRRRARRRIRCAARRCASCRASTTPSPRPRRRSFRSTSSSIPRQAPRPR